MHPTAASTPILVRQQEVKGGDDNKEEEEMDGVEEHEKSRLHGLERITRIGKTRMTRIIEKGLHGLGR